MICVFAINGYTMELIENIMSFCVDDDSYERMFDFKSKGIDTQVENYEEFYNWNKKCVEEMAYEDKLWLNGLCMRLKNSKLGMMDLEDCGIWTADQFFFDKNKKLCIVHPR